MPTQLTSPFDAVTGILDRDQHRNPIVGRYAYNRQQVYKILLSSKPRTKNQRQNSNRFRQAVLTVEGIYHSPPLLNTWRSHYLTSNATFRNRHYKSLYGFILANILDNM